MGQSFLSVCNMEDHVLHCVETEHSGDLCIDSFGFLKFSAVSIMQQKPKKKKKSNQLSVLLETAVKAASLCSLRHLPLLTNEVVTAGSCLILAAMPQIN